jgi:hypothetical protein
VLWRARTVRLEVGMICETRQQTAANATAFCVLRRIRCCPVRARQLHETRLLVPFVVLALGSAQAAELSDARIRELLIQQSIANYPGNCPCPYNVDRAGRRCGARSAYSKAACLVLERVVGGALDRTNGVHLRSGQTRRASPRHSIAALKACCSCDKTGTRLLRPA